MEKWKPKEDENYFYVKSYMEISETGYDGLTVDKLHFKYGNYFRTREKAEQMAKQIKKLLSGKYELTERK